VQRRTGSTVTHEEELRQLSSEALVYLGAPYLAFIKPTEWQGASGYGIYAADGMQIAVVADRNVAFALACQHDLNRSASTRDHPAHLRSMPR